MKDFESYILSEDNTFFARELASFVPDKVFDAHAHLWHPEFYQEVGLPHIPRMAGYSEFCSFFKALCPGREIAALFIPHFYLPGREGQGSEWLADQVHSNSHCRGEVFIHPNDNPESIKEQVCRLGLDGFKCYHTYASTKPTWQADMPEYLPEDFVRLADSQGWVITLHLVKSRAVADPSNIHWIRYYCKKYPSMKLILAHSARGFQPQHNLEGLPQLRGLDNLYFDASANCEPIAHQAVVRILGHKKLLYGSDFPIALERGRSVAVADSFLWLYKSSPVWQEKHACIKPVLVALEHLRSLKWACWSERLSDTQVEDIFWNNAVRLFG